MAKVRSRVLVVDASVARASGDASMHPTSQICREVLLDVLEICHCIAMSEPIKEEWNRHQSRFARTWRLSMMARKKIRSLEIEKAQSLELRIPKSESNPFLLAIMEKDRRLLEAAIVTGRRVLSLDDRVRLQFRNHAVDLPEIRAICWVNPTSAEETVREWLASGAPEERSRTLGF